MLSSRTRPTCPARRTAAIVAGGALITGAALSPSPALAKQAHPFTASPAAAVAGQTVTLTGEVPTGDSRPLVIEKNDMGTWYVVGHGQSHANGTFEVTTRQGAMDPESFRVVAPAHAVGGRTEKAYASPARVVHGIFQDVSIASDISSVLGAGGSLLRKLLDSPGDPQRFTLDAQVYPAVAERQVSFQRQRADGSWAVLGTKRTAADGTAHLTTSTGSDATYRAVAGRYRGMAWYPSLPDPLAPPDLDASQRPADKPGRTLAVQPSSATSAAATYHWGPIAEDWNWEYGESLNPWSTYADGSGDARTYVGMLLLESGHTDGRDPNYGDVTTTLRTAGHAYGRWEWKSRAPESGDSYLPYTMNLQLVPHGTTDKPRGGAGCAVNTIDAASFTGYSSTTTVSASHGGTTYSRLVKGTPRNGTNWHTYAVEVTPKRVTWLIDHKVVGSAAGAATGLPLVPRMELRSEPGVRMTHTRLGTDWVRYYPLGSGTALPKGSTLRAAPSPAGC